MNDATLVLVPFWLSDNINFMLKSIKYLYCVNSGCFHNKSLTIYRNYASMDLGHDLEKVSK